jgi:hypothetical protein
MSNGERLACAHPIDRWVHVTFEKDNGAIGDSFDCGLCDTLMQVS